MSRLAIIIIAAASALQLPPLPALSESGDPADFLEPGTLYIRNFKDSPEGVYQKGIWTFFKIVRPESGKWERTMRQEAILGLHQKIREYLRVGEGVQPPFASRTLSKSAKAELLSADKFQYYLRSGKILYNEVIKGNHVYVYAVHTDELNEQKQIIDQPIETKDWVGALQALKNREDRASFYFRLGSIEDGLLALGEQLAEQIPLENYFAPPGTYFPGLADALTAFSRSNSPTEDASVDMLRRYPGYWKALNSLARLKSRYFPQETIALLLAGLADSTCEENRRAMMELIKENCGQLEDTNSAWKDYESWINELEEYARKSGSVFESNPPLAAAFRSYGHLHFPSAAQDSAVLDQAKKYFYSGKSLEYIIDNLSKLIQKSPQTAGAWQYLGPALMAKEDYPLATVVLIQALQINPTLAAAKLNLARCYEKMNLHCLAQGAVWSSLVSDDDFEFERSAALNIIADGSKKGSWQSCHCE